MTSVTLKVGLRNQSQAFEPITGANKCAISQSEFDPEKSAALNVLNLHKQGRALWMVRGVLFPYWLHDFLAN